MKTIKFDTEKLKRLYRTTENVLYHLAAAAGLSCSELEEYYKPRPEYNVSSNNITINNIYLRFLLSLQNRSRTNNIIALHKKECDYRLFFLGYAPKQVAAKYNSPKDLYDVLTKEQLITSKKENSSMALQWCQGALDGAKELAKYATVDALKQEWDQYMGLKLPLYWSKKIKGMGFALSCDFFKEIGYDLPKPDVHIRNVFEEIFSQELKDIKTDEELCTGFISAVAQLNQNGINTTAYKFDRMIWLACTGKFFLHKDMPESLRDRLIVQCMTNL